MIASRKNSSTVSCKRETCHRGARKRYKDSLKASLGNLDLDVNSWEELATDRENWRAAVHSGAVVYEERQTEKAEEERAQMKASVDASGTSPTDQRFSAICHALRALPCLQGL